MNDRRKLRARVRQGTNWYKISNLAGDGGPAEIAIFDEIGYWGVSAGDFLAELKAITASEISLRLNSPGGEIFDGIAIYNTLRSHAARVTVHVDGLAASIASVIAMAGDRIVMAPHSQMMIHDAMTVVVGNAAEMREVADQLDRQSDNIAAVYAERAGGTARQWRQRMVAETWYSAAEAVGAGLADEVSKPVRQDDQDLAARWDLSVFAYAGRSAAPAPDLSRTAPELAVTPVAAPPVVEPAAPSPEVNPEAWPVDEPAPELVEVVVPVAIDPEVFRAAMRSAAGGFEFDPDDFRQAMTSLAGDAPAVPAPAPEPDPEPVAPAAPEPEPEPTPGEVLREVVATLSADAPAEPAPVAAVPAPEPPPAPAPGPEPLPEVTLADIVKAAIEMESARMSAPPATPKPEPEPDLYDATVVSRALKEAMK